MNINKIFSHIISQSEFLSEKRYDKMLKHADVVCSASSKEAQDEFNRLYYARDVIANYACKNHLNVKVVISEPSLYERVAVIEAKKGKCTAVDEVQIMKNGGYVNHVHSEVKNSKLMLKNNDGKNDLFYTYQGIHSSEDNLSRAIYRTVEKLNDRIKETLELFGNIRCK